MVGFDKMSALSDAEARKAARAHAEVRVYREHEFEAQADVDALYWDRIPIDQVFLQDGGFAEKLIEQHSQGR